MFLLKYKLFHGCFSRILITDFGTAIFTERPIVDTLEKMRERSRFTYFFCFMTVKLKTEFAKNPIWSV